MDIFAARRLLLIFLSLAAMAPGILAQDLPMNWTESGIWFANSNDSFGQGLPLENDDFHSYGFAAGWNFRNSAVALYWDIYTFRGTLPGQIDRTDRLLALYRIGGERKTSEVAFSLSGTAGVYADGNLGGLFVQQTFHHIFSDFRPLPEAASYDRFSVGLTLGGQGSASWTPGIFRLGLGGSIQAYAPLALSGDLTGELGIAQGCQSLMASLRWESPIISLSNGLPENSAWKTVKDFTQGFRICGFVRDGPVFYEFEYLANQKSGDGIIGFLWSDREYEQPLWAGMDAGLMTYRMRDGANVEEMAFCRIRLSPLESMPGHLFAEIRNGGLYMDLGADMEVRLWGVGAGYEYSKIITACNDLRIDPYARALVFFGANRILGCTGYRGVMRYDTQNLGIGAAVGTRLLGTRNSNSGHAGIDLGAFAELPILAFNSRPDMPVLIQTLRLGFLLAITSGR